MYSNIILKIHISLKFTQKLKIYKLSSLRYIHKYLISTMLYEKIRDSSFFGKDLILEFNYNFNIILIKIESILISNFIIKQDGKK